MIKNPTKNKKKIIGLTGVYCSGKNHIAFMLEKRNVPVLDLDKLGHEVIELEKETLVGRFGKDILRESGMVDRKILGAKVFGKSDELAALEQIIHPAVNRKTMEWIKAQTEKICVINAALLHRSEAFDILDAVIIVQAPLFIRLLRGKKRDHLPWKELIKRFRSQKNFNSQFLSGNTDIYKVENSGFFGSIRRRKKLEQRINEILSLLGMT